MYVCICVCVYIYIYKGELVIDVVVEANCDQINNRNAEEVCICMYL